MADPVTSCTRHDPDITGYLFEHARDIILVIDAATGAILDANRAAEIAYRYSRDELLALCIFDLRVEDPASVEDQMQRADHAGLLFHTLHRRRDGSTFPVEVSSRGDEMGGRRCLFSIIRDITERRRFEEEREDLLRETQRALALRDDFLMIAAHELRTPITGVMLKLQQLARLCDRAAPHAQILEAGTSAYRESRRLATLIDMLLDAQVAKGHIALDLVDVDLADIVAEVTERIQPHAESAGSTIVSAVPTLRGRWDRLRLDQVLTNLLFNAIKYGRGQPIDIAARCDESRAIIEVVDRGIGVRSADAERIFEKFERAVPTHYGGLGLGLFITRQIVEAHGGELEVESTPGVGSTFRVILPLR